MRRKERIYPGKSDITLRPSIGANLTEAQYSINKKEFLAKTTIALKECAETEYWLDLLKETKILTQEEHENIMKDCKDILHILIAIAKTTRNKLRMKNEKSLLSIIAY